MAGGLVSELSARTKSDCEHASCWVKEMSTSSWSSTTRPTTKLLPSPRSARTQRIIPLPSNTSAIGPRRDDGSFSGDDGGSDRSTGDDALTYELLAASWDRRRFRSRFASASRAWCDSCASIALIE